MNILDKLTIKELSAKCREHGLKIIGTKKDLVERLCHNTKNLTETENSYLLELEDNLKEKKNKKGALCSKLGNKYELDVYKIVSNSYIDNILFNTQNEKELGGSTSNNDIECSYKDKKNIGIEIKKCNTPDWMQCSIMYDSEQKKWMSTSKCKIPEKSRELFNKLIENLNIFNGKIPPFVFNKLTYDEWKKIKNETDAWNDVRYDIPNDTIKKLYEAKGCKYIQISNGYGLYHLGEDICGFDVPEFNIEQQFRVRIKVHSTKNKQGNCNLTVTIACQPKKIKDLEHSPYSLDDPKKLPPMLVYKSNQ
tara:strand:- start:3537 stop:4457 length:921 start_codon:yes stop_codon:yes gene_type:complete